MPEYVAIKNFEHFQQFKHKRPTWIRLYSAILDDEAFINLNLRDRGTLMMLLLVASKMDNRIPSDSKFLRKILHLDERVNLQRLVNAGFVVPVTMTAAEEGALRTPPPPPPPPPPCNVVRSIHPKLVTPEFIETLRESADASGLDIDNELRKMDRWLLGPGRGKARSQQRFINWLNRATPSDTRRPHVDGAKEILAAEHA